MIVTLNKKTQLKLTDLVQDNYTDIDLYREKPMLFDNGTWILIIRPVPYREHDIFLKEMAALIFEHYEIFHELEFLSAFDYKSDEAMSKVVEKVGIFTANKKYSIFKKDSINFVKKWGYISKKKEYLTPERKPKKIKRFLEDVEPSEMIYILYLIFVFNFDIVKKNTIEFLKMFTGDITLETSTPGTSSDGTSKRVVVMPKFSRKPFSKSTLNLLEKQSQMP